MPDDIEDTIAWKAASDRAFSTANAFNSILQVQNTCNTNVFCWVWKWKRPERMKLCFWVRWPKPRGILVINAVMKKRYD